MKLHGLALLTLAGLALTGCRTDPNIPILERELRMQEDEIWRLRRKLDQCERSAGCAAEAPTSEGDAAPAPRPAEPNGRNGSSRHSTRGSGGIESIPLTPPAVEMPTETLPEGKIPERLQVPDGGKAPAELPAEAPKSNAKKTSFRPRRGAPRGEPTLAPAAGDSREVGQVAINRLLTGGYEKDSRPGDDGVLTVVELRDAQGKPLEAPMEVSVAVVDPAIPGEAGRVARWDFTAGETAGLFRRTPTGPALYLQTPWPEGPPVHSDVHLFVRATTADGRHLEADQPLSVSLTGERSTRWVPADPPPAAVAPPPTAAPAPLPTPSPPPSPVQTAVRPQWSPERR